MQVTIDKNIVKRRFNRNISFYNEEALVQKEVAKELIRRIIRLEKENYHHVLEIGCGTGFLTQELLKNFSPGSYIINDLSGLMQSEIQKIAMINEFTNWRFMEGDAEKLSFPCCFDLVVSASAIQWFQNTEGFISSISHSVLKNGIFAFSTFGRENYREIKTLMNTGLEYPSVEELISWLSPFFRIIDCSERIIPLYFASPRDALIHISHTGVNAISNEKWNRNKLAHIEASYCNNFSNPDGTVSLTYQPVIIIAKKK